MKGVITMQKALDITFVEDYSPPAQVIRNCLERLTGNGLLDMLGVAGGMRWTDP